DLFKSLPVVDHTLSKAVFFEPVYSIKVKGKGRSPPEFLATRPTTWQADVTRLRDLIRRFGDRGPAAAWPPSRVFGRISGRSWGVLEHKHLDHHLRQFGV